MFLTKIKHILFLFTILSCASLANATPVRALHIVLGPLTTADVVRIADLAATSGYNTMILDMGGRIAFPSFPGKLLPSPWSRDEFVTTVAYIRSKGMDVIPGIQLLTHQGQFFAGKHPELMLSPLVYDPENPMVYKLIMPYLDEVITAVKPKAIHIGHDEAGLTWNKDRTATVLSTDTSLLPATLFLKDVITLNEYLKSKSVKTWMWGDMLIAPTEFPNMLAQHFHGITPGYGKALRLQIPKDIVICDWHYWDDQTAFTTIDTLKKEGFTSLGATWRKAKTTNNFSAYAATHGAQGMIETTWFEPQRKTNVIITDWNEMTRLITDSGAIFKRDFP